MIAILFEGNVVKHFLLKEDIQPIKVLGIDCYFIKDDIYHFRITYPLQYVHKNTIQHNHYIHLINHSTNQKASIIFSNYSGGFNHFLSYKPNKNSIYIGTNEDNDIVINDLVNKDVLFEINFNTNEIIDLKKKRFGAINNKSFIYKKFNDYDVVSIFNVQIFLHHQFIMVNQCDNCIVNIPLYNDETSILTVNIEEIYRKLRYIQFKFNTVYTLRDPISIQKMNRNPVIFTLGPSLMISIAALTSGLLNAYKGSLTGRDITDMIPLLLLPGMMLISALTWIPLQRRYEKTHEKKEIRNRENRYRIYLDEIKENIKEEQAILQQEIIDSFPEIDELIHFNNPLLFQKTSFHNDWLYIRLGIGDLEYPVQYDYSFKLAENDAIYRQIEELKENTSLLKDSIYIVNLLKHMNIALLSINNHLLYRILIQLMYYYANDQIQLLFVVDETYLDHNPWLYQIQNLLNVSYRPIIQSSIDMIEINHQINSNIPTILFIQNQKLDINLSFECITKFYICEESNIPNHIDLIINEIEDNGKLITNKNIKSYTKDIVDEIDFYDYLEKYHHYLLPSSAMINYQDIVSFFDLYEIDTIYGLQIEQYWKENKYRFGLEARIGINDYGKEIRLDLSEQKHGPHGLIAGMTGSGKSIFLMNLLLSLCVNYSPKEFQFIIIDFKGGGLSNNFNSFNKRFPHLSGVLTNLDTEHIERCLVSFRIECEKREKAFKELSEILNQPIMSLKEYQENYNESIHLEYLPSLLIIVDEFAELKRDYPDFLKELIRIARVGRSLGIHLILSTQKPAGIVDEQIWANTSFKICMKVQEKQDSNEILHSDVAMKLTQPGQFYFLNNDVLIKGKCGYTHANISNHMPSVQLLNYQNKLIKENIQRNNNSTQFDAIKDKIIENSIINKYKSYIVWEDDLKVLDIKERIHDIGIIDDYYHRSIKHLTLHNLSNKCIIFCSQLKRRLSFLYILLLAIIEALNDGDELYVIDYLNFIDHQVINKNINIIRDSISFIKLKDRVLKRDYKSTNKCFIVLLDYSFLLDNPDYYNDFYDLTQKTELLNIHLYLFASSPQIIPYRLLSSFQNRIVIDTYSNQDLSLIYERSMKKIEIKDYFGLIQFDHILSFSYYPIDIEELCVQIDKNPVNLYKMPSFPNVIRISDYQSTKIPLGISYRTWDWIDVDKDIPIIIVDQSLHLLNLFSKIYSNIHIPICKEIPENKVQNTIYYLELHKYESIIQKYINYYPILFLNNTHKMVYSIDKRIEINELEGLFYYRGRYEVIRYVEE